MDLLCGVDEAGRGPVIGPMVLAASSFDLKGIEKLKALNVRDSKKISDSRRRHLEPLIMDIAVEYKLVEVSPAEIDSLRKKVSLNQIEADRTVDMLLALEFPPSKITVDSCDSNADGYKKRIVDGITGGNPDFVIPELVSEHKADDKYLEVGGASVLAKVRRDKIIDELKLEYGDFGSGYPSDEATQKWLRDQKGVFPDIVRMSWNTVSKARQATLGQF